MLYTTSTPKETKETKKSFNIDRFEKWFEENKGKTARPLYLVENRVPSIKGDVYTFYVKTKTTTKNGGVLYKGITSKGYTQLFLASKGFAPSCFGGYGRMSENGVTPMTFEDFKTVASYLNEIPSDFMDKYYSDMILSEREKHPKEAPKQEAPKQEEFNQKLVNVLNDLFGTIQTLSDRIATLEKAPKEAPKQGKHDKVKAYQPTIEDWLSLGE